MPKIGEIRRAEDAGLKSGGKKVIWIACLDCGKERWVLLRGGKPQSERCHPCGAKQAGPKKSKRYRGAAHWNWNGGRHVNTNGYITVALPAESPFAPMRDKCGQVYEHRLIMAQYLGRCLTSEEEVHHKNHDKHDNCIENLEITDRCTHAFNHANVTHLLNRISELEYLLHQYQEKYGGLDENQNS